MNNVMKNNNIVNAFSIDVEDYFQVSAFSSHISLADWDSYSCRVEGNVNRILTILDEKKIKATFFTLGWIARRYPQLVREIVREGHELASHGYGHQRASDLSEEDFYSDIDTSKKLLEDLGGVKVNGYRAPSFSIGKKNMWAFDCLVKAGYRYSSSIYPIRHDHYGMPDFPRFSSNLKCGILEIPMTTLRMFGGNLPSSGGGYFRLLPYTLSKRMIQAVNSRDRQPAIFYMHPWEMDVGQPVIPGLSNKTRFRHYLNINKMEDRLNRLLHDFKWDRIDSVFANKLDVGVING